MKFATVTQVIILTVVSCIGLFALDYYKNPQLWHRTAAAASIAAERHGVQLTLWMNHLCCSACLDDVRQALANQPALDLANAKAPEKLLTQAEADKSTAILADYGNRFEIPVRDLDKLDFVAVDRALRDKGMVAGRMEISGVEHFRLEAKMDHMCCGTCQRSTPEHIDFLKAKGAGGQFVWLDSVNVNRENKTITAYARYLQPGAAVDVNEFISGLNESGFAPRSVQVLTGEHMEHLEHMGVEGSPADHDSHSEETAPHTHADTAH